MEQNKYDPRTAVARRLGRTSIRRVVSGCERSIHAGVRVHPEITCLCKRSIHTRKSDTSACGPCAQRSTSSPSTVVSSATSPGGVRGDGTPLRCSSDTPLLQQLGDTPPQPSPRGAAQCVAAGSDTTAVAGVGDRSPDGGFTPAAATSAGGLGGGGAALASQWSAYGALQEGLRSGIFPFVCGLIGLSVLCVPSPARPRAPPARDRVRAPPSWWIRARSLHAARYNCWPAHTRTPRALRAPDKRCGCGAG